MIDDADRGDFHRAGDQIIHEAAANELTIVAVGKFFVERSADTVGNAGDFEQLHEGVTKMLGDEAFEAVTVQYDGARGLRSDVPQPVWWSVALSRAIP